MLTSVGGNLRGIYQEKWLIVLNGLRVFHEHFDDFSTHLWFDLIKQLLIGDLTSTYFVVSSAGAAAGAAAGAGVGLATAAAGGAAG